MVAVLLQNKKKPLSLNGLKKNMVRNGMQKRNVWKMYMYLSLGILLG